MKRPQIHLRDLFWLLLVTALLCAWWLQEGRVWEARRETNLARTDARNAERLANFYLKTVEAYRRDGRLGDVLRNDGSVYVVEQSSSAGNMKPLEPTP